MMKISRLLFLSYLLLAKLSLYAKEVVSLGFIDGCRNLPVSIAMPELGRQGRMRAIRRSTTIQKAKPENTMRIDFLIQGLSDGDIEVALKLGIPGMTLNEIYNESKKKVRVKNGSAYISIPLDLKAKTDVDLKAFGHHNFLVARATWVWTGVNETRSGQIDAPLLIVNPKVRRFYYAHPKLICRWQSPLGASSEVYLHQSTGEKIITLSREQSVISRAERNFFVGPSPSLIEGFNGFPSIPSLKNSAGFWFFVHTGERNETKNSEEFVQKWKLNTGSAAMFMSRMEFSRFKAIEYEAVESNGCKKWQVSREGLLDVGELQTSFYQIPVDLIGDPEEAVQFVARYNPQHSTCNQLFPQTNFTAVPESQGLIFFNPRSKEGI